jgi:hypothetical protein
MNLGPTLKNHQTILKHTGSTNQVQARIIDSQQVSWHFSFNSELLKYVNAFLMAPCGASERLQCA